MGSQFPQEWEPTLQACRSPTLYSLQQHGFILQDPPPVILQASACCTQVSVGTQVQVGTQVLVDTPQISGMGTHSQARFPTLRCSPPRSPS